MYRVARIVKDPLHSSAPSSITTFCHIPFIILSLFFYVLFEGKLRHSSLLLLDNLVLFLKNTNFYISIVELSKSENLMSVQNYILSEFHIKKSPIVP